MIAKTARLLMITGALALVMAGTLPASAKGAVVTKHGSCSRNSDWKMKLSPDNGKIEVEFEVDSNVNGQTWHVQLFKNGGQILATNKVTRAPSGSFELRKLATDTMGRDTFRALAHNIASGENCVGVASI
jgi:hypothetical protein